MTEELIPFQTSISSLLEKEDPLKAYRQSAFKRLQEIGFPTPKNEAYRYLRMPSFLKTSYQKAPLKDLSLSLIEKSVSSFKDKPHLVFYNGHFLPRFSNFEKLDPRIIIKPLSEAIFSYGLFFKNMFQKWVQEEKDFFSLLTFAQHEDAAFIYVPNNIQQKEPLMILHITSGEEKEIASPFVITSVGKNSSFNLAKVSFSNASSKFLNSELFFLNLEEEAKVSLENIAEKNGPLHFEALRVWQKKRSSFKAAGAYIQTSKHRYDCYVQLLGKEALAEVFTLSALKEKEEMHTHILIEHQDEASYSRQLVKNLYDDESLGSFEGKIFVHDKAQKTNAYQLNQNCLLSDMATSYSKPNLEIFADDVKASHGSTTGQIDQDQLFYLQSRGLSLDEAKRLLLNSFCLEIVQEIQSKELKELILKNLLHYFIVK